MSAITNHSPLAEKLRTKRGESRLEFYAGKDEPFGLNRRTRRIKKIFKSKQGEK